MKRRIKRIVYMLLSCIFVCCMLSSCGGTDKGERNKKKIEDLDTSAYIELNTSSKKASIKGASNIDTGYGVYNLNSRSAVSYSGTYAVGNTITFTYTSAGAERFNVTVSFKVPKDGEKTKIEFSY
ncbi:MAG: hypothetical protein HDT30_08390 [Clostridiales bacterium]|nr:hypothetical protein [Clostridiales bacterium]